MKKNIYNLLIFTITLCFCSLQANAQQTQPSPSPSSQALTKTQFEEWSDDFKGDKLDETKWEKYTFEGGSGGKIEVKDGEVRIRGASRTRAGIRSKQIFTSDKFVADAHLAKVGVAYPEPGDNGVVTGFANLTILFDGSGRNRVEWILTSEGKFEAWAITDGRGERLDNRQLATKMKNPVLAIVRRGDEFLFVINSADGKPQDAQVGLKSTVKNMPKSFRVMLYGYGSSENNWGAVSVVVPKQN